MLIGEHDHTLDPKHRVSLPSKFRTYLGKKVVITRGLETCLFVYSPKEWQRIVAQFQNLSLGSQEARAFNRFMLSGASEVEVDSAGRVLVPDPLVAYAGLKEKVSIIGVGNRGELWDSTRWNKYRTEISDTASAHASTLAERGSL